MSSSSSLYSSSSIIEFDDEDRSLDPALIEACRNNDFDAVQAEIAKGTEINNIDDRGFSALHIAVENESFDVLKLLLKQPKIRKNEQCFRGCTALGLGCKVNKEVDCILELIAAGCDINLLNIEDEYPLISLILNEYMQLEKRKTVIELFIKNGLGLHESKIIKDCIRNYEDCEDCLEILHLFLCYNIDVNSNSAEALTMALKCEYFDICDALWDYIADFTADSDELDELLFLSIKYGYKCHEVLDKCLDKPVGNFFEENNILHAFFYSTGENVDEILNTLWMRFQARDKVDTLINNADDVIDNDLFETDYVNKECVIRFVHLFFNFVFESKTYLYELFPFSQLYIMLRGVELDEMIEIFYLYLMCTSRICYDDLKCLYRICSKDEFETFLKVNIKILLHPLTMEYKIDFRKLARCKETYTKFDCILYPDLLPLDMEDEEVPSLLKLSRNVIRKQFQPNYKTMIREDLVYFRYYNKVNNWVVPKRIKDILLLNV